MREILFRGKTINGLWVYWNVFGDLTDENGELCPHVHSSRMVIDYLEHILDYRRDIIPETVGQYTGLKDLNGKNVFEGDIIESPIKPLRYQVGKRILITDIRECRAIAIFANNYKIIGNVYDNPELLEVVK